MISELMALPILAQFGLSVLVIFLLVGALVCMSFVIDVLVAAARATSMTLMRVALRRRSAGRIMFCLRALGYWRDDLVSFYRRRHHRVIWSLSDRDGGADLARWSGIFRWEFFGPRPVDVHTHSGAEGATTGEPK